MPAPNRTLESRHIRRRHLASPRVTFERGLVVYKSADQVIAQCAASQELAKLFHIKSAAYAIRSGIKFGWWRLSEFKPLEGCDYQPDNLLEFIVSYYERCADEISDLVKTRRYTEEGIDFLVNQPERRNNFFRDIEKYISDGRFFYVKSPVRGRDLSGFRTPTGKEPAVLVELKRRYAHDGDDFGSLTYERIKRDDPDFALRLAKDASRYGTSVFELFPGSVDGRKADENSVTLRLDGLSDAERRLVLELQERQLSAPTRPMTHTGSSEQKMEM